MSQAAFFEGHPESRRLFDVLAQHVARIGPATVKVSKSQIAFLRARNFALAWMPGQYLHHHAAPLVLTILMPSRIPSKRWKEVVEPAPGRFTHHLELWTVQDLDAQVDGWLRLAWDASARGWAGRPSL